MTHLAGQRATRYRLLPERFSYEPLAPIVRRQDRDLLVNVRDAIDSVIDAEHLGLTRKVAARRGKEYATVAAAGNYGEIYARNLEGPLRITADRGANRPVRDGGMLCVPSVRKPEVAMTCDTRLVDHPGLRCNAGNIAAPR